MKFLRRAAAALAVVGLFLLGPAPALADTTTTHYALIKPVVGGSADTWGTSVDTNYDSIDTLLFGKCDLAGCTYTGPIIMMTGDATHAPLKFVAGTNLTSPAAGAVEWDGTNLYITQTSGPTRKTLVYTDGSVAKWTTGRTITLTGDVTGVSGSFDGSGNLSFATTGVQAAKLTTARNISMTGDVAWTASFDGSGNATAAGTIQANAVTNAKSATMADGTIKCNASGSTAVPSDCVVGAYGPLQNSKSADYTFVLADQGKEIYHPSADTTARAWTIPANGSVAYLIGTKIELTNDCSAGVLTLAITTDTLVWLNGGVGGTGSRSIAACSKATLTKETATRWSIVGNGVSWNMLSAPDWMAKRRPANDNSLQLRMAG